MDRARDVRAYDLLLHPSSLEPKKCEERVGRFGPIPHLPRRRTLFVYSPVKNNFGKAPIDMFPVTREGKKTEGKKKLPILVEGEGGRDGGREGKKKKKREKFDDILRWGLCACDRSLGVIPMAPVQ